MPQESQEVTMTKGGQRAIFPRANLLRLKAAGWREVEQRKPYEEEGTLKKIGRGAAMGTFAGVGIPETLTPIQDLVKNLGEQARQSKWWDPTGMALTQVKNVGESLGRTGYDVLKDLAPIRRGPPLDVEKTSHDIASLATQILMLKGGKKAAETPLSKGTLVKGAKTGTRELLGVGEKSVQRARTAAEEAAAEKTAAYQEKKTKYDQKVAEAKAEHEAKMAKKVAQHEADVAEAKAKHQADLDAAEQSLAGKVTKEAHARLKESRLNKATKILTGFRDKLVSRVTKNIDAAEKAEGESLDARYEDFRKKVLGVSEQAPNGTHQSELTPVGEAVINARKNILKGSSTSIPIFNDIMGRLKDLIEAPDGTVRPIEGQTIPTDQLRGYQKEISSAIYEKTLPGDVKRALGHVLEEIQNEVQKSIKDTHGQSAVDAYKKLSEDWSAYKRVWYDRSSGSPLPRILRTIRYPVALQEGVNIEGQVADLLSKRNVGDAVTTLLARKRGFGADPALMARLIAVDKKIAALPDLYERIPVAKYPRFPKYEEPKPPEIEPFKSTREAPEPPSIEKFSPEKFRRETIGKQAESMSRLQFWDVAAITGAIEELLRGKPHTAAAAASYPVIKRLLARGLSSEPILRWLTKEGEQAPPTTPGGPPPGGFRSGARADVAETSSLQRPEFRAAERSFEIARLKSILSNPKATAADKMIARLQLDFWEQYEGTFPFQNPFYRKGAP